MGLARPTWGDLSLEELKSALENVMEYETKTFIYYNADGSVIKVTEYIGTDFRYEP